MEPKNVSFRIATHIPPGDSLVGFIPWQLFRYDRIELPKTEARLSLIRAGTTLPCDGRTHEVAYFERTLCVGNFIALHVRNDEETPQSLNFILHGKTIDEPSAAAASLVTGAFVPESGMAELPQWQPSVEVETPEVASDPPTLETPPASPGPIDAEFDVVGDASLASDAIKNDDEDDGPPTSPRGSEQVH